MVFIQFLMLISSSNQKSCELDPLPPFIIINILDYIIAFLVYKFNRSLSEGCLPESQKRAIVFPALRGHPFMTSTRRGEGSGSGGRMWTGGFQPHVDVHTEN